MNLHGVEFPEAEIAAFCARHGISRLSLFGSILREDFGPASDVDVLVDFLPGSTPTLFGMAAMEADLSELIGRKVDLRTPRELSKAYRDTVMARARLLHAA